MRIPKKFSQKNFLEKIFPLNNFIKYFLGENIYWECIFRLLYLKIILIIKYFPQFLQKHSVKIFLWLEKHFLENNKNFHKTVYGPKMLIGKIFLT
jgi:hypothetical protein